MLYYLLKYIHIISSTLLFGTGLGSAFYMWRANRGGEIKVMLFAAKNVVIADWLFTTPAVIIQPVTGFWLLYILHYPMNSPWIIASLILYVFVGLCWLPVVWLQIKMHRILQAVVSGTLIWPVKRYFQYERMWFYLGWPAFLGVLVIFYLMVFKPNF